MHEVPGPYRAGWKTSGPKGPGGEPSSAGSFHRVPVSDGARRNLCVPRVRHRSCRCEPCRSAAEPEMVRPAPVRGKAGNGAPRAWESSQHGLATRIRVARECRMPKRHTEHSLQTRVNLTVRSPGRRVCSLCSHVQRPWAHGSPPHPPTTTATCRSVLGGAVPPGGSGRGVARRPRAGSRPCEPPLLLSDPPPSSSFRARVRRATWTLGQGQTPRAAPQTCSMPAPGGSGGAAPRPQPR